MAMDEKSSKEDTRYGLGKLEIKVVVSIFDKWE